MILFRFSEIISFAENNDVICNAFCVVQVSESLLESLLEDFRALLESKGESVPATASKWSDHGCKVATFKVVNYSSSGGIKLSSQALRNIWHCSIHVKFHPV